MKMQLVKKKDVIYICLILMVSIVLSIRAFYSFDFLDESYYIAMVDRFWKGALPVIDEWNPAQFFFPLWLPLYSVYRLSCASGDGVFLFFRLCAIAFSSLIGLWLYVMSKRIVPELIAFLIAALTMLYCRGNIFGITYYNTYAVSLVLVAMCCMLYNENRSFIHLLVAGIGLAVATCTMPFWIIGDLILGIALLIRKRCKQLGIIILGVLLVALPYVKYLTKSFKNMARFIANFPMITNDQEHTMGWIQTIISAVKVTLDSFTILGIIWIIGATLYVIIRKEKSKDKILVYGTVIVFLGVMIFRINYIDRLYVYFTGLSFAVFLKVLLNKRNEKVIRYGCVCYIAGLIASICFVSGSNVNIDAISTGCVLSCVGLLFIFESIIRGETRRMTRTLVYGAEILFCIVCLGQRIICVYNDAPIWYQSCRIENGPAKGLYTTPEKELQYKEHMSMAQTLVSKYPEKETIYLNGVPIWIYIVVPYKCNVNTVWQEHVPGERFEKYFVLNQKKVPDIIILGENGNMCSGLTTEIYKPMVGETIYNYYSKKGYVYESFPYADAYIVKD